MYTQEFLIDVASFAHESAIHVASLCHDLDELSKGIPPVLDSCFSRYVPSWKEEHFLVHERKKIEESVLSQWLWDRGVLDFDEDDMRKISDVFARFVFRG